MILTLGSVVFASIPICTALIQITPIINPIWVTDSESLQLTCAGDRNITWYKDSKPVISDDHVIISKHTSIINGNEYYKTILRINQAKSFHSGRYNCSDGNNFKTRKVKVVRGKLAINFAGTITTFEGDSLMLFCKYEGNIKLKVSWVKDKEEHLSKYGFTSRRQTVKNRIVTTILKASKDKLTVSDSGIYYCQAGPLLHVFTLYVLNDSCNGKLISGPEGVPDQSVTASSYYKDILHDDSPYCAKWNQSVCGGWSPVISDKQQWIQVSFSILKIIREINLSGRRVSDGREEWVTSYTLSFSQDGRKWRIYSSYDTNATIFEGNFDSQSYVTTKLPVPIVTKHVRIHPLTWHRKISLRLELQGCTLPTKISTHGESRGIIVPDQLFLTCNVTGPKLPNIVWYKDGTRLLGSSEYIQSTNLTWYGNRIETIAVLKKMTTMFADSGKYTCKDTITRLNKTIDVTAAELDMIPSFSHLWIMKDDLFELTCEYRGTNHKEIEWANIDNIQTNGFYVSMHKRVESGVSMTTSTLRKDVVSIKDSINISCSVGSLSRQTELKIITGEKVIETLERDSKELSLHCNIDEIFDDGKTLLEIYWTKNQQPLSLIESMKGKFRYSSNSRKVIISDPDKTVAGHYECNILIKFGKNQHQHFPIPVEVHARPELELKGLDKVTEGETLHLYCKETGYPLSAISWYKDGIEISKTDARHNFMSYDNVENGHFVLYSVTATDTGNYECKEVSDTVEPTKSSLFVTVKKITLTDNLLMVCIVVSAAVVVLSVICCVICLKCRKQPRKLPEQSPPQSHRYSQPLLIKRYVDMEVVTKSKSLTSLEEIDQLPLPPPPVDPWEETSTTDGGSLTYERIPRIRDRRTFNDANCA